MLDATETAAPLGHNNPPAEIIVTTAEDTRAVLSERYKADLAEAAALLLLAAKVPDKIEDDETQGKAADLVNKMAFNEGKLEAARKLEKKPFDDNVDTINALFNVPKKDQEEKRKSIKARTKAYTDKKADEERARLAKIAEDQRREAAENLARAEAFQNAKIAATAAVEEFEEQANAARMARAGANTDVEKAQADVEDAKLAIQKLKVEGLQMAQDYTKKARDKEPIDEDERKRRRDEHAGKVETAKKVLDDAKAALATAEEIAEQKRKDEKAAADKLKAAQVDVREATTGEKLSLGEAVRSDRRAGVVEKRLGGAGFGAVVSDAGSRAGQMRNWRCDLVDINLVPLDTLRHLIDPEAIRVAGRKWMLNQPANETARKMPGFIMEIDTISHIS